MGYLFLLSLQPQTALIKHSGSCEETLELNLHCLQHGEGAAEVGAFQGENKVVRIPQTYLLRLHLSVNHFVLKVSCCVSLKQ